jgi:FkbM family methyltransferase
MNKYFFKEKNQSSWICEVYNQFLPFKINGLIVEIGVGHTLKNVDSFIPENLETLERCGSNSADLLDLGWNAIYIEPVKEYCDEVLISHKNNLDRIKIINMGASDCEDEVYISMGDSLSNESDTSIKYNWIGRKIKTKKTSDILIENFCNHDIDIMSIDVEGFEAKVLQGLNFEIHSPKILIVETNVISATKIEEIIPSYYTRVRGDDLNTAWVKNVENGKS